MVRKKPVSISDTAAKSNFGVHTQHEAMENGEKRFRLHTEDTGSYILTIAESSGWQKSHYHEKCMETYLVQDRWMLLAQGTTDTFQTNLVTAGQSITIKPSICHNTYLPGGAVIHTVKHGKISKNDWRACPSLDDAIALKSTDDMIISATKGTEPDQFSDYISLYNNLDNLLWKVPGFLLAISALMFGFLGNIASAPPPISQNTYLASSGALLVVALLNFAGVFTLLRIRIHHDEAGDHLAKNDAYGYFINRSNKTSDEGLFKSAPGAIVMVMLVINMLALITCFLSATLFVFGSGSLTTFSYALAFLSAFSITTIFCKIANITQIGWALPITSVITTLTISIARLLSG